MVDKVVHSGHNTGAISVHQCLSVTDQWQLSWSVEGAVKANTSVRSVKGVGRLCARALCQELHVFIGGGGVSENDPRNLPDDCQGRTSGRKEEEKQVDVKQNNLVWCFSFISS